MKMNLNNLKVKSFVTDFEKKDLTGGNGKTNNKHCFASAYDACPTVFAC